MRRVVRSSPAAIVKEKVSLFRILRDGTSSIQFMPNYVLKIIDSNNPVVKYNFDYIIDLYQKINELNIPNTIRLKSFNFTTMFSFVVAPRTSSGRTAV